MVHFLINSIFSTVTAIANLLSRSILTVTAYLLVLVIQVSKVSGGAIKTLLEQLCDALKSFAEYFFVNLVEVVSNITSTLFDLVKEGISDSVDAIGSAIAVLVEQTGNSVVLLLKCLAQVLEGFAGMVSTILMDLWNNVKDAAGYVTKNA